VVLVVAVAVDLMMPPRLQLSQRVLVAGLRLHRVTLARWLTTSGLECRFEPTCSRYAETCLRELGTLRASWWIGRRLLRCGPWTPAGTSDPPPATRARPGPP
jgi:putative membrane protein insertion efficiency factor